MTISVVSAYSRVLEQIASRFVCPEIPLYRACPENIHSRQYAVYSHTVTQYYGTHRVEQRIYNIINLMPTTVDINPDLQRFLNRDFVTAMADTFRIEDKENPIEYLTILLQTMVSDRTSPLTIEDILLERLPQSIRSEAIAQDYKKESKLYSLPLSIFDYPYDNCWDTRHNTINLNSKNYPIAWKCDANLKEWLANENLAPLLRQLIRIWIFHQLITQCTVEKLMQHDFYRVAHLEETLTKHQNTLIGHINTLLCFSVEERRKIASEERYSNRFSLPILYYQLTQRFSLARLIAGHAKYDIHQATDPRLDHTQRFYFYLQSFFNLPLIRYFIKIIVKQFNQSRSLLHQFIYEKDTYLNLLRGIERFIAACYMAVWLPFIALYCFLISLSSLPFWLLRKASSLPLGGWFDITLSLGETLKDMILAGGGLYFLYYALLAVSQLYSATLIVELGAHFIYTPLFILSPVIYFFFEEPNHFQYARYQAFLNDLRYFSSAPILSTHGFIIGTALISYAFIALAGRLMHHAFSFFYPKALNIPALRAQQQNANHSPVFKTLIRTLQQKLETSTCDANDHQLLSTLATCQLPDRKKASLKTYLQEQVDNPTVEEKSVYRVALSQIDKPSYLPSWKLIARLHREVPDKQYELQETIDTLHTTYSNQLVSYQ